MTDRQGPDLDVGAVYAEGRARVVGLVADLPADRVAMTVPACPEWQVRDVVAHLSGACADILAGRLEGVGTDRWTEVQVAARRDRDLAEILAEWNENAPQVEAIAKGFGPAGKQWVFDFATHEQDLRGALERPGARDADSWWIALEFITAGFHAAVARHRLAPIRVVTAGREWNPDGVTPADTLIADPFELGRALTGRRSTDQVRAFEWSTDPEPYLAAFVIGPFALRSTDLVE